MSEKNKSHVKVNSILVSGRKDQTLTYTKYVRDEKTGASVEETLDKQNQIIGEATGLSQDLIETIEGIDTTISNLKDMDANLQSQLDDHQSQLDDKQSQITTNKEQQAQKNASLDAEISSLHETDRQLANSIKDIAVTGGASTANAVTYDNENSSLDAVNIQAAIDELQSEKFDKSNLSQELGTDKDKTISQYGISNEFNTLRYILEDTNIELNFTKAYQYISISKIRAGRKVTNNSSFTIYLCKGVNDFSDKVSLKSRETIFVNMDISAIRCGEIVKSGELLVYKDYTDIEGFSKIEENYKGIIGYSIECTGEASSINAISLIPKGTKVANVGDVPFSLHGENYSDKVSLTNSIPVYLDFDAVKLTIGENASGVATLKVFGNYIDLPTYKEDAKENKYSNKMTILSFDVKNTYEFFNLEIPIPVGVKVSNECDVPFYLYSDGDARIVIRANEHLYTDMEISRVRAASYIDTIKLGVFSKATTTEDSLSILKSQFDDSILNIAYSTLEDDIAPVNTVSHFEYAISKGFNVLKSDMRLTKDNEIILCHDAGFTLNEEGRIIGFDESNNTLIRDLNKDDILKLEHAGFYEDLGKYEHPTTLEKFLIICKTNNVIPYITFRSEYIEETLSALVPVLEKFNYTHKCIINANPPSVDKCYQIRKLLPFVTICHTLSTTDLITTDVINQVYRMGNAYLCANTDALDNVDKEVLDYSRSKEIRILGWFVSDPNSYEKYIANGFCGFQITASKVLDKNEEANEEG